MAGIDKTYTDSYKEYKTFKDWADKQRVVFFDGHSECIGDWVYNLKEVHFNNGEITIMNTPTWMDVYLIQNCKDEFVIDRMKDVYGDEFKNLQLIEFHAKIPDGFKQNRKISIQPIKGRTKFPLHNHVFYGKKWWLQCEEFDWWYNDDTKTWVSNDMYYPTWTNTAHIKSIKGVIRHLRKQYLPVGIEFHLNGRYIGEEYKIIIK